MPPRRLMASGGRAREMSESSRMESCVRSRDLGVPVVMILQPSNRREKPWSCGNCSPYLKLAAEPHGCVTGLLHKSSAGENSSHRLAIFAVSLRSDGVGTERQNLTVAARQRVSHRGLSWVPPLCGSWGMMVRLSSIRGWMSGIKSGLHLHNCVVHRSIYRQRV
jgi:hypothetical protein